MNALKKAETAKSAGESAYDAAAVPGKAGRSARDLAGELGLDPQPAGRGRTGANEPLIAPSATPAPYAGSGLSLELEPATASAVPAAVDPTTPPARGAAPAATRPAGFSDSTQSARTVFTAKKPPAGKSRMPFFVVVGCSLAAAGGYGAYLWKQMQPPSPASYARAAPAPAPAAALPPVQAPAASASQAPPAGGSTPEARDAASPDNTEAQSAARAGTSASADRADAPTAPRAPRLADAPQLESSATLASRRDAAAARRDAAQAAGGAAVQSPANLSISRTTPLDTIHPDVASGYAALKSGDLDAAAQFYEKALRSDSTSRDALLGIATIHMRLNRMDAAEAALRRVLRLHPQDAYAAAQLAALQSGADPIGALSQVNSIIARDADRTDANNGALPFIQGNQLASQGRWNEAQQSYFNAHRADPNNPDYCYNLAVSLDRIHETRLAREFYAKALDLARSRPAGFDTARAQTRLAQLGAPAK